MDTEHPRVFISHSSDDKARFVTGFARRLRETGIDAWIDEWEMQPGDSLVDKIFDEGIGQAQALIVVLSRNSVKSNWVREEINAGFVRRVSKKTRLIPVIIDKRCPVPAALQSTIHVRIEDVRSYDQEFGRIVSAIFGLSNKPELGASPPHSRVSYVGVPNLARIDNIILRLACERAIEGGGFESTPDHLWERVEPLGISRRDMDDSLLVLDQHRYIKGLRGGDQILAFTITLSGFHVFATAYIRDLDGILRGIVARFVNDNLTCSGDIADALGQPHLIIEYLLQSQARLGKMSVSAPLGRYVYIGDISPELRRLLG